jgi:hypothetical protein
LQTKQLHGKYITLVELFTVSLFLLILLLNYLKTIVMSQQYDELSFTAANFTAYIDISRQHHEEFTKMYGHLTNDKAQSRGVLFQKFIKSHFKDAKIARIDLVYDNTKMLNLLESRGTAIKMQDNQALFAVEDEVEEQKKYAYHTDIVGAFLTFESEAELHRVLAHRRRQAKVNFSPERTAAPSNTNWYNLHIKASEKSLRFFLVALVMLSILYMVEFKSQVVLSDLRFANNNYE